MSATEFQAAPYPAYRTTGNTVYISGQNAEVNGCIVEGGIAEQTKAIFELIEVTLASAGCSFADVVKVNGFLHDEGDFGTFNNVYREYFGPNKPSYPARSMALGVLTQLQQKNKALIEIEMIAQRRAI